MEKEELSQDCIPSILNNTTKDEPLRKPIVVAGNTSCGIGGGGSDRLKRDEWSEGAVSSLLDAYESKWILRNRAKLKGHDWEDVARHVSLRANSTKSPKTQTQCKNKIESMKKRYRSESAATDPSSWPLFQRLDLLLRCRTHPPPSSTTSITQPPPPLVLLDQPPPPHSPSLPTPTPPPLCPPPPPPTGIRLNSHEYNDVQRSAKDDQDMGGKIFDNGGSDKILMEMGSSSTPISNSVKEKLKMKKNVKVEILHSKNKIKMMKKKKTCRHGDQYWEVAESIRWLAEVVMRSEQGRMDTLREIERMRVEAEAKKGELDLKKTEIIASTQLQIAKILASSNGNKDIDSSLRIGRN